MIAEEMIAEEMIAEEVISVVADASQPDSGSSQNRATYFVSLEDLPIPPARLVDLALVAPGVDLEGQGGLLGNISIRGLARQRTAVWLADAPIYTERRAGSALSFIDPLMLDSLAVVRGPLSLYYGSGALGGALEARLLTNDQPALSVGYSTGGDERWVFAATGNAEFTLAGSQRERRDDRTPEGDRLHDRFKQTNLLLSKRWTLDDLSLHSTSLYSRGSDIGKSNASFSSPLETSYPLERHLFQRVSLEYSERWQLSGFLHYQKLNTELRSGDLTNRVRSSANDFGVNFVADWSLGRWGLQYLGRRDVRVIEDGLPVLDGRATEMSAFFDGRYDLGFMTLEGGARLFRFEDATRPSGFIAAHRRWDNGLRSSLSVGSGLRYPSLTEREFSGLTPRGLVVGNPDLKTERSLSTELLVNWSGLQLALYHMRVNALIQRERQSVDELTFLNLDSGEIHGAELEWRYSLARGVGLTLAGHYIDSNRRLQGVGPSRVRLGLQRQIDRTVLRLNVGHRFAKRRVSSGELPIDRAVLISAQVQQRIGQHCWLSLWLANGLNDSHRTAVDELSPVSARRSVGLSLGWRPESAGMSN